MPDLDGLLETSINRISSRLSTVELEFMRLAGTRLAEIGIFSPERAKTYLFSAEFLGDVNSDLNVIKRKLNQAHRKNERDMGILSNDITSTVYSEGASLGRELSPKKEYQAAVNPMLNSIMRNYRVMEKSTALNDTYKKTIRQFVSRMTIDEERISFPQAMRQAIGELTENGISFINYRSGRQVRMDSAVRNALMTEFTGVIQEVQNKIGGEIGADAIEVSAHAHAAEDHEPIQGRIFTIEEWEKLQDGEPARDVDIEKYERGEPDYLGGTFQTDRPIGMWNCRHIAYNFLLGISEPSFSKSELERLERQNEEGVNFHGKDYSLYEAEQKQRQLETAMRHERENLNLLKEVRDTDPAMERDYQKSRERLAALRDEYKELGAVLQPHAIRMKMERSYVPKLAYGADSGGLREKGETAQNKYANTYYEAMRNRKSKSDISAIAKNTDFTYDQITAIREHIYIKEHNLGEGVTARFSPDYQMAQAWQRLEQGKGTELDKLLLNHELEELILMEKYGYDYRTAHDMANKKYPWGEKIKEEEDKK